MGAAAGAGGGSPPLGWVLACCGLRFRLRAVCCCGRPDRPRERRTMWLLPWTRKASGDLFLNRRVGPAQSRPYSIPPAAHGTASPPPIPQPRNARPSPPSPSQGSASAWRLGELSRRLCLGEGFREEDTREQEERAPREVPTEMAAMVGARRALLAARYSPRGAIAASAGPVPPYRLADSAARYCRLPLCLVESSLIFLFPYYVCLEICSLFGSLLLGC